MNTQTVTVTLPFSPCAASAPDYVAAIDDLSGILCQYHEWSDTLSQDLLYWGTGVLQTVVEHRNDSVDVKATVAQERLGELFREILIDPITQTPLTDPVIDGDWTLEREVHSECRRIFPRSPLDGRPMSPEPLSHRFAGAMIRWMHQITTPETLGVADSLSRNVGQRQVALLGPSSQLATILPFFYQQLVQAAVVRRQNRQLREQMNQALVRVDQCMVQMRERSRQVIGDAVARAREHEAALQERIASINRTYQQTISGLNGQIDAMEERHRADVVAFEQQMASTDQANSAAVNELRRQIEAMNQEHHHARASLERQIEQHNQENRQEVSRLEAQLSSTTQASQAAMASVVQTHSRTVSGLQGQIAENEARLSQTQAHLAAEEARNAQNAGEIQRLQRAYAQAQQQICRLQQEVANSDGGFCSIM